MPLPAGFGYWIAGHLVREGFRRYGRGAAVAGAASFASRFGRVPYKEDIMPRMPNGRNGRRKGAKRQKVVVDHSGYAQYTKVGNKRSGKWLGTKAKVSKLLNSHCADVIERFQNVTNVSSGGGAYYLNYDEAGLITQDNQYPFYMMDLTCVKNNYTDDVNITPVLHLPSPFWRLRRGPTGPAPQYDSFFFKEQDGVSAAGAANQFWQTEREPHYQLTSAASKQFLEWVDIRLVLYGARKVPSHCWVEIWQFTDTNYVPQCRATNVPTATALTIESEASYQKDTDTESFNKFNQFYGGQIDSLLANPIMTRDLKEYDISKIARKKFSKKFTFQPTLTTENDVSGHQFEFKLRHGLNKVCNYVQNPIDTFDVPRNELDDPNRWNINDRANFSPFVDARGREFLVIRAFTPRATLSEVDRNDYSVSFDMIVRRKRTMLQGL